MKFYIAWGCCCVHFASRSELLSSLLANLPILGSWTVSLGHSEIMSQVSEKLRDKFKSKEVSKKKKRKEKRERDMVGFFWVSFWFLRLLGLTKTHVFQALSSNSEVWKLNFLQEKAEILVQCMFPGARSLSKRWNNMRCNKKHWGWQYCRRDGRLWLYESSNDERSMECRSEIELLCL